MLWHCSALLALLLCYAAMRCGTALRCYGCCAAAEGRCVTSSPLYLGMRLDNISDADLAIVSDVITASTFAAEGAKPATTSLVCEQSGLECPRTTAGVVRGFKVESFNWYNNCQQHCR